MTDTMRYMSSIDTIYPDGYARETIFRSPGDMLTPATQPSGAMARLWQRLSHWRMKRAGRLALSELTNDQLRDIGLTRVEADREVRKSRLLML
ncbi:MULTISPECIES: DUF1127 domain-containing protein [Alphaproteobacteria]|nr:MULTISPECIES: DUF1127 domain-containing protein [Alphaproteobacteria]